MSSNTTTPTRHRFIVFAPDYTAEGTLDKRLSVRSAHLERAKKNFDDGFIRVGGAMLTPESIESPDSPKKMAGSAFICEAENINQVWEYLKSDVYYTAGVWDPEKITVHPYITAHANL